MYLVDKIATANSNCAMDRPPFGPGFSKELVAQSDTMEIWGSNVSDPGKDFTLFKLFKDGKLVAEKTIEGY